MCLARQQSGSGKWLSEGTIAPVGCMGCMVEEKVAEEEGTDWPLPHFWDASKLHYQAHVLGG